MNGVEIVTTAAAAAGEATLMSSVRTTSACKRTARRGIVDFLRPARARLVIGQSVSPKLYATRNPGGEIGPGIPKESPFRDHDAFECFTVPPVSCACPER